MQQTKGNLLGLLTILSWSCLALFTVYSGKIPPFELLTISFCVASLIGLIMLKKQKRVFKELFKIPLQAYFIGVIGLFGYHFFYFLAIKNAPAVEANLINYLWPLLIVIFSSFLPNERLKWFHILGTLLALSGAFLLVLKDGSLQFDMKYILGYSFALIAALLWSSYSVISKTLTHIPTFAVTGFCIVTAFFSAIAHLIFEQIYIPTFFEFFAAIMLGLGPVGGAFYLWDFALKNADIKLLGSLAYLAPLLSTLILVLVGISKMTITITIACILIVLGSLISSKQYLKLFKNLFFKS
ncbi:EamA family transporter [Malaciobacter halophilus]|uniref:EamA family transporter n=1 Tax=Malaciobacter halophilus TaxID=197482 RepID=A0A2N1J105_9BACT|nr:EamA family transporter [Malaciobacter halophilus]